MTTYDYIKQGDAIYRRSYEIIKKETDLSAFTTEESWVVLRMIHACGRPEIVPFIQFSPHFTQHAIQALKKGKPILCDSEMVAHGITRTRLPAQNAVICTLHHPQTPRLAQKLGITRSAAALELWKDQIEGAVIAIGNAPTALFHCLEMLADLPVKPAAIIGIPVGFVGASESKEALAAQNTIPFLTLKGREGGSAITAAALNALAKPAL